MLKILNEYQYTIDTPCYLVAISDEEVYLPAEEHNLKDNNIIITSDFYIVDTFEKVQLLLQGEKVDDVLYPIDIFKCNILVPNIYKIIRNSAASGFMAWFQYDENYINEPIITIEPLVMTADNAMSAIQSFSRTVSHLNNEVDIFIKWLEITKLVGIEVDLIHLETYLAQTLVCEDNELQLFRNSSCKKAKLLSLKNAVKNLYPIRALFFENLGNQITHLPLKSEEELSTLDKLLSGKL